MEERKDNRSRFERQRRNLLIISLLLISYMWLGLKIDKLNFLGNEFTILNTSGMELCLWLLLGYFLIRYYQFFTVIENKEFHPIYLEKMHKHVQKVAEEVQRETFVKKLIIEEPSASGITYSGVQFEVMKRSNNWWEVSVVGSISFQHKSGSKICGTGTETLVIKNEQLYWPKIKSRAHVGFSTPHLTEYFLPVGVALLAVAIKLLK